MRKVNTHIHTEKCTEDFPIILYSLLMLSKSYSHSHTHSLSHTHIHLHIFMDICIVYSFTIWSVRDWNDVKTKGGYNL